MNFTGTKIKKNHNKFSSRNIAILSQNNVRKYCTKGHEQVSCTYPFLCKDKDAQKIVHAERIPTHCKHDSTYLYYL